MAEEHLFTVTFEHLSGLPEDRVVWTFPMRFTAGPAPVEADFIEAKDELVNFLNDPFTTGSIAQFLSEELSRAAGAVTIRAYDIEAHLDGSAHGSPVYSSTSTLDPKFADISLPGEVAAVLTTRALDWDLAPVEAPDGADPGTLVDRPRQRLSGRNYIGPLNAATLEVVSNAVRVDPLFVADVLDAANALHDGLVLENWNWCVWSRVNEALVPIEVVQMDNAFDSMRKRGPDSTVRTSLTVA